MAVSADTQAIIDRLKQEGDLIRNSGTNSVKTVGIKLDKFNDAFMSISNHIAGQTEMMTIAQNAAKENMEFEKQQRDFDDLKREKETSAGEARTDKFINKMGDKLEKISLSNIAQTGVKAGALGLGGFAAFNLMKGFIDEKYDGAFSDMQTTLGSSFSGLANVDFGAIAVNMESLSTSLAGVAESMAQVKSDIDNFADNFAVKAAWWLATTTGVFAGITAAAGVIKHKMNLNAEARKADLDRQHKLDLAEIEARRNGGKGPDVDTNIPSGLLDVDIDGNSGMGGKAFDAPGYTPMGTALGAPSPPDKGPVVNTKSVTQAPKRRFGSFGPNGTLNRNAAANDFITRAADSAYTADTGRSSGKGNTDGKRRGTFASQAEIEASIKDVKMLKIFKNVVKGFAAVGIVWTIYDLNRLWGILTDPNLGPEGRKMVIIEEIGSLITSAALAAAGGFIGVFGGPWGILIGTIAGGVLGAFAGPTIAGYIYDWATEVPLTREQALETANAEVDRLQEITPATGGGHAGNNARKRLQKAISTRDSLVSQAQAASGLSNAPGGMNSNSGGLMAAGMMRTNRAHQIMRSGSPEEQAGLLNALIAIETSRQSDMQALQAYLANPPAVNIINAPNVSPNISQVEGAKTVNDVKIMSGNGGGNGAAHMLPYMPGIVN